MNRFSVVFAFPDALKQSGKGPPDQNVKVVGPTGIRSESKDPEIACFSERLGPPPGLWPKIASFSERPDVEEDLFNRLGISRCCGRRRSFELNSTQQKESLRVCVCRKHRDSDSAR